MKHLFLTLTLIGLSLIAGFAQDDETPTVTKIWDEAPHNAFPDMIRFRGMFYVSVREGNNHMPDNSGRIRIIRSKDGEEWESVGLLEKEGMDVREARLSVTPEGKIMVLTAVGIYDQGYKELYPMVAFSDEEGVNYSSLQRPELTMEPGLDWIWSLTWHKGIGYGVMYTIKEEGWETHLLSTRDGLRFETVSQIETAGNPNESTLRFDENDQLYVLVRRETADKMGVLAKSEYPYTNWNYTKLPVRLGGPNFLFFGKNNLLIGTRDYRDTGAKTVLHRTDRDGNIEKTIEFPSGGDTSYPGMLYHKNNLWLVYYSSHEEKTSLYLSKIPLKSLRK
ncbi:hypothetical protein [Cyclobacterium jeungdonense]|uniref:Exo-alpha-sialidase n=1 Tax=Cyclobacterium jeungdonense TaxID=708087 RepID=A0ABT8C9R3_9BACT|nr:hypothetical protein [Cyclobacterium jeungdonense]MDN3688769.1 hypothetical protein [Cyclobacterium jeungdonense]